MGAFELEPFAEGTRTVAEALAANDGHDRGRRWRLRRGARAIRPGRFGHPPVDRGGAALELLEGKPLPGVEALDDC